MLDNTSEKLIQAEIEKMKEDYHRLDRPSPFHAAKLRRDRRHGAGQDHPAGDLRDAGADPGVFRDMALGIIQ